MGRATHPFYRVMVGVFLAACIWLLLIGFHKSEGKKAPPVSNPSARNLMNVEVIDRKKNIVHRQQSDFENMSKRRVPNGPDPIHNRGAGKSGRPPGHN